MPRIEDTLLDVVRDFLKNKMTFQNDWHRQSSENPYIQKALSDSSKNQTGHEGYPDLIYCNEKNKILILLEFKSDIKDHEEDGINSTKNSAIGGAKHYISFFTNYKLKEKNIDYFNNWRIIGLAFSGDIRNQYLWKLSTYILRNEKIEYRPELKELLNELDYLALFENYDIETITVQVSETSKLINNMLRSVDSQNRPILLSALMICLFASKKINNSFRSDYQGWSAETIIHNIPDTLNKILKDESIPLEKIQVFKNQLSFVADDIDLSDNSKNIIKQILDMLKDKIIPLFDRKTNYDILGKFYEEFLRFAGVANVKKGIVLTPYHITTLFSELIPIKRDEIIFDPCCGTGAFLIAGMQKLISSITNSDIANKIELIENIKTNQLVGIEKHPTMYSLALSNMLFRGDGKSRLHFCDFFSDEASNLIKEIKPTIGFMNPPYAGDDSISNPTKKEIQFVERLLDSVSRYAVIIAPISVYFKEDEIRNRILTKHTLKYVINMPNDLFQPNAMINTAIAVFETGIAHQGKEVIFYDMVEDGFILSKNKGRTDAFNKWDSIKMNLIDQIMGRKELDKHGIKTKITMNQEWIFQAHAKIDFQDITENDFIKSIKEMVVFKVKKNMNLLNTDIDGITLLEILHARGFSVASVLGDTKISNSFVNWQYFCFSDIFNFNRGKRLIKLNQVDGDVAYISSSKFNNGIDNFITPPDYMTIYKNKITINNSGSVGSCFFHDYNFVASDHTTIVWLKDSNKSINLEIFIFLKPILEKLKYKYNFGREMSDKRLANEIILLPVTDDGSPDWLGIENYIKSLPYYINL